MQLDYTPKDVARFLSKAREVPPCLLYEGAPDIGGYGRFNIRYQGIQAHRFAYIVAYGDIPDGRKVLHTCSALYPPGDNTSRRCIKPDHLRLGTQAENVHQSMKEGRFTTGDRNGRRRSPQNYPIGDEHYARLHPEKLARGDRNGKRLHPELVQRGESVRTSKLTADAVLEIRRRCALGDQAEFIRCAHDFGVTRENIYHIVHRNTWRHI